MTHLGTVAGASTVGGLITFFCLLLATQIAKAFLVHNSRLFTAMALLACSWALVLCNYGFVDHRAQLKEAVLQKQEISQLEKSQLPKPAQDRIKTLNSLNLEVRDVLDESRGLVVALSSFLLVFVGGLLMLEGKGSKITPTPVDALQYGALWLLVLFVAPKALDITFLNFKLTTQETSVIIDCIARIIGFIGLSIGAWYINKRRLFAFLAAILLAYSATEIFFYISIWDEMHDRIQEIPVKYYYLFAVLKVLLTVVLGAIVVNHAMPKKTRARGCGHWLFLLVSSI